ncbi:MAG: Hpt domain-containing protein [Oscillospiraceae bacterium]
MLTIESLKAYGADVEDGLKRCMNFESFYLELVQTAIKDTKIESLETAIDSGNLNQAFEIAHAMKGMYTNLSLTPLSEPIIEITELLRNQTQTDYSALLSEIKAQYQKLTEIDQ